MKPLATSYKSIWLVDFEFIAKEGNIPEVVCLVAHDLVSGMIIRSWQDELYRLSKPPYDISNDSLFIAYYASAEFGCHLSLGWGLPVNVIDLFVEFRNKTNGISLPCGAGLIGALSYFGLDS
ncbi:MAG: DNA polymerase I, partial [Gammaproteobacteria bacterium]